MSTKKTRGATNQATAAVNVATDGAVEVLTVTTGVEQANNQYDQANNNLHPIQEESHQLDPFAAQDPFSQNQAQNTVNQPSSNILDKPVAQVRPVNQNSYQPNIQQNQANAVNTYNNANNANNTVSPSGERRGLVSMSQKNPRNNNVNYANNANNGRLINLNRNNGEGPVDCFCCNIF